MCGRPTLCEPPPAIVDRRGDIAFGVYGRPLRSVNLDEARLPLGWLRMGRRASELRLKEWQHFVLLLPEAMLTFAIVDSKFLRVSWCHFSDHEGKTHFEHERKGPALDLRTARELWNDRTHVSARRYRIEVDNALDRHEHRIRILIAGDGTKPSIEADLRCLHDLEQVSPLVVVLPVGRGRAAYSHKVPLPMEGTVRVGDRVLVARAADSYAILDIHKAHYPRHTWWNWATFAGRDDAGRSVGLNLTSNVNRDDARFNENAVWLDGKLETLAPARFEFDPNQPLEPWHLGTKDGAVDLTFEPRGERSEDLQLGLVRSVFHQPYGVFSGTIRCTRGVLRVKDAWGVCEDHDAVW